ncbi:MAG: polysaccharide biosynthesis C-terminal domain-containing protein, partial [Streptococcus sp.]
DFVSFFLGKDFEEAYLAIAIMVFRMFFIGWTNIMGIQILIPHNKHREFMLSTTIPAVVSVGLNLLLIPPFGFVGASIVSVLTEALVWFINYFSLPYLKVPILSLWSKIVCICYDDGLLLSNHSDFHHLNVLVYAVLGGLIYLLAILV